MSNQSYRRQAPPSKMEKVLWGKGFWELFAEIGVGLGKNRILGGGKQGSFPGNKENLV